MNEYPVFVPHGEDRLAAVLALPDGEPRGLVVLSTGVGASRAHRFQVWARLAELLAARDIASIRYEYIGMHDSTGTVAVSDLDDTPIDQVRAAARFARDAVGLRQAVAVGNCYGGHGSLELAAEDEDCIAAVCILPRTVRPGRLSMLLHTMAGGRVGDFIRGKPRLRRIARPLRRINLKQRGHTRHALPRALRHAKVIFLIDAEHRRRMNDFKHLKEILGPLSAEERARFELRVLPGSALDRFGSIESQRAVIDALPEWISDRFEEARQAVAPSDAGRRR